VSDAAPARCGAVLLTGATGSIGRPLLDALAVRGVEQVYALTHRDPLPGGDPRVRAVAGDVTVAADLGLIPEVADEICSTVTGIIHAAAETRFAASGDLARAVNAGGTRNVLAFASRCRRLDRVLALSTTHVAGRRTGDVFEHELEHDTGFVNAYEASKYEAESVLRARAGDLPVSVCRLSTVIGDSRTGEIARRGAIHQAVLLMYASLAPMVPGREDSPVDLVALDYAVEAIAWLATGGFTAGRTWHLCAGAETISAGELLDLTLACCETYRPAWRKRAIARPALVDLATFELFRHSIDQIGDAALRASTDGISHFAPQLAYPKRFDNRVCAAALADAAIAPRPIRGAWRSVVRRLVQISPTEATKGAGGAD
jgi:nucleoside-diphosphate-sugar epimerase